MFDEIRKAGFVRVRVDGTVFTLDDEINLDRYKIHTIEAVVDRIVLQKADTSEEQQTLLSRLTDSVETSLKVGEGYLTLQNLSLDPPAGPIFFRTFCLPGAWCQPA